MKVMLRKRDWPFLINDYLLKEIEEDQPLIATFRKQLELLEANEKT